jgi:RNA polymerase sigma factor (TIGR02999 family)
LSWDNGNMGSQRRTLEEREERAGSPEGRDDLLEQVYVELRQIAGRLMRRERPDHSLQATAVVNEAVIRLLGERVFERSDDRAFLIAAAARAMREVLIDHARRRAASRRGGGMHRVSLDLVMDYFQQQGLDIVSVHEALSRLAELKPRQSHVITLRYFGGLTVAEIASSLEVSQTTVERDLRLARAWLFDQLGEDGGRDSGTLDPN